MVTGRIKNASKHCKNARDVQTVASAGVQPGADRCTAYSVDERASVWAHSQNNQLLWHQFTANNGAISSSPSLLPLSFSPLSLSLPPSPLCFRDEYITLPSSKHFILRWMFVKWNGKMSYGLIPLSFPSLPPSLLPSLDLSQSLPCILQIKDNPNRIWNATWGLAWDNGIYPWVDHLGFYVTRQVKVEQDKGTALRSEGS